MTCFIIGLFAGSAIGVFVVALLSASGDSWEDDAWRYYEGEDV